MVSAPSSSEGFATLYEIEPASYQERILFLGANGSGKTVLASEMISGYPRAIVLDVKYDFPIPWESGDYIVLDKPPRVGFLNALKWVFGSRHVVYRPRRPYDSGEWITYFLDRMFDKGRSSGKKNPFILYIDEGLWASYAGAWQALARLAVAGRSLGIGLWLSSQRPKVIPVAIRSEAWRMYIFYLRYREDRKEIIDLLEGQFDEWRLQSSTEDYQFWEIRRAKGGKMVTRLLPPINYVLPVEPGQ